MNSAGVRLTAYKNVNLKGLNDVLGDVQDEDGDHQDDRQDANAERK